MLGSADVLNPARQLLEIIKRLIGILQPLVVEHEQPHIAVLSQAVERFETATGTSALHVVSRVGEPLHFVEHEPRNHQVAAEHTGVDESHSREPVRVLEESSSCEDLAEKIFAAGEVAIHCELSGTDALRTELLGLGICPGSGEPCYLAGRSWLGILRGVLQDGPTKLYAHDFKVAWVALRRAGVTMPSPHFDTMVAAYLLNPNRRMPSLETLSQEFLLETLDTMQGSKKARKGDLFELAETDDSAARAGGAAYAIARLRPILADKLAASGQTELFERIELPLTVVLAEIEANGFRLDTGALETLGKELDHQLSAILEAIYRKAGMEFNVNSPSSLARSCSRN